MTIELLEKELLAIYDTMVENEGIADQIAAQVHPKYRLSAKNLYRYLLLRSFDLRSFHDPLTEMGLSSLRSAEGYVFSNISNVLKMIHLLQSKTWSADESIEHIGYEKSKKLLRKHAKQLFVETHKKRRTEIMVTLPVEVSENLDLLRKMVTEGMEIARINLGRDNMAIWQKMISNIKIFKEETGHPLKVYMDLSGPKLRVADIEIAKEDGKTRSYVRVQTGDALIITKEPWKGTPSLHDEHGILTQPAKIGVLIPEIIDDVKVGDRVFFDDGKIRARVVDKTENELIVSIRNASKTKLSAQKGINLPDTALTLPALTNNDLDLLDFVCENADIVGYSFVQTADDVDNLYKALAEKGANDLGVVIKVETNQAFENLPKILIKAMERKKIGVMIARGDLAVELGFERISEVQNEILWICEAAHIPVIWATQVFQNLTKKGVATRAEVSDASISSQAECVMLNKGPYILIAIRTLKSIIKKMEKHYSKKKSKLRELHVASSSISYFNKTIRNIEKK